MSGTSNSRLIFLPALALFFAIVVLRIGVAMWAPAAAGYSPLFALVLCLSIVLVRRALWIVPALAYLVSDLVITTSVYGEAPTWSLLLFNVAFLVGLVALGRKMGSSLTRFLPTILATAGSVVLFYLLSNTFAWAASPSYAKTIGGWIQSQTTGLPGFPASLYFLKSMLVGNLAFAAAFVALAHTHRVRGSQTITQSQTSEA